MSEGRGPRAAAGGTRWSPEVLPASAVRICRGVCLGVTQFPSIVSHRFPTELESCGDAGRSASRAAGLWCKACEGPWGPVATRGVGIEKE